MKKLNYGIGKDGRRCQRWLVEVRISDTWVDDGFGLDKDRARGMVENLLPYANTNEFDAVIVGIPK
jgi:hypothetical protein